MFLVLVFGVLVVIVYVFICLIIIVLTGEFAVEGEEVGSKFYGVGTAGAVQAKTIRLRVKEREPLAVIISKLFIVCGYLLEYMFASLFDALLQTVIDTSAEYTAYSPNNFCLLKALFSVYFIMFCGFVDGIFNNGLFWWIN